MRERAVKLLQDSLLGATIPSSQTNFMRSWKILFFKICILIDIMVVGEGFKIIIGDLIRQLERFFRKLTICCKIMEQISVFPKILWGGGGVREIIIG